VYLEADAPRVTCRRHGVTVAAVPWARHNAGHTRAFDQQVAWLVAHCSKSALAELMRIGWRTVGTIIARVWADVEAGTDLFADLRRIGIDEVSYRRGGRYLSVVVNHDTGAVVWTAPGAATATLQAFFDLLGPDRCALISHVSADGAPYIAEVVRERCPQAVLCADPFHVVKWTIEALDEVRRQAWNTARRAPGGSREEGGTIRAYRRAVGDAAKIKHSRLALSKNPETLTDSQRAKLAWIAETDPRLYQAYLMKEALRMIFKLPVTEAVVELDAWIDWAIHSDLTPFVKLARRIARHRAAILAAIEHSLSNGRVESVNAKIRLITRIAYGFTSTTNLIALIMLTLGGHRPTLPGRK
jgi:transposase